jgi:hypothetical protein
VIGAGRARYRGAWRGRRRPDDLYGPDADEHLWCLGLPLAYHVRVVDEDGVGGGTRTGRAGSVHTGPRTRLPVNHTHAPVAAQQARLDERRYNVVPQQVPGAWSRRAWPWMNG